MTEAKARMHRLLARLTAGGLPLMRALEVTAEEIGDPHIRDALLGVNEKINVGETLSGSARAFPDVFSPLACDMLDSGEQTGQLDTVLDYMSAPSSPFVTGYTPDEYPFIRMMDLCVCCNVGLIKALATMAEELEGHDMQMVAELMHKELDKGGDLSVAARALPWLFPEPLPALIEVAEQGGMVASVFEVLACAERGGIKFEQDDAPHMHDALRRFVLLLKTFLEVGAPFAVAVPALAAAEKHPRLKQFLEELDARLKDWSAVNDVMGNYTDIFTQSFIRLIEDAEAHGDIVMTLGRVLYGMQEGIFLHDVSGTET